MLACLRVLVLFFFLGSNQLPVPFLFTILLLPVPLLASPWMLVHCFHPLNPPGCLRAAILLFVHLPFAGDKLLVHLPFAGDKFRMDACSFAVRSIAYIPTWMLAGGNLVLCLPFLLLHRLHPHGGNLALCLSSSSSSLRLL